MFLSVVTVDSRPQDGRPLQMWTLVFIRLRVVHWFVRVLSSCDFSLQCSGDPHLTDDLKSPCSVLVCVHRLSSVRRRGLPAVLSLPSDCHLSHTRNLARIFLLLEPMWRVLPAVSGVSTGLLFGRFGFSLQCPFRPEDDRAEFSLQCLFSSTRVLCTVESLSCFVLSTCPRELFL